MRNLYMFITNTDFFTWKNIFLQYNCLRFQYWNMIWRKNKRIVTFKWKIILCSTYIINACFLWILITAFDMYQITMPLSASDDIEFHSPIETNCQSPEIFSMQRSHLILDLISYSTICRSSQLRFQISIFLIKPVSILLIPGCRIKKWISTGKKIERVYHVDGKRAAHSPGHRISLVVSHDPTIMGGWSTICAFDMMKWEKWMTNSRSKLKTLLSLSLSFIFSSLDLNLHISIFHSEVIKKLYGDSFTTETFPFILENSFLVLPTFASNHIQRSNCLFFIFAFGWCEDLHSAKLNCQRFFRDSKRRLVWYTRRRKETKIIA